jgi:hypothetical protein
MFQHDSSHVSRSLGSLMRKPSIWAPPAPVASVSEATELRRHAHETHVLWSVIVAARRANSLR